MEGPGRGSSPTMSSSEHGADGVALLLGPLEQTNSRLGVLAFAEMAGARERGAVCGSAAREWLC